MGGGVELETLLECSKTARETKVDTLLELSKEVQKGKVRAVVNLVTRALEEGMTAHQIIEDGLLKGLSELGIRFRNNEVFVPEVLNASKALNIGTARLREKFVEESIEPLGLVILATIEGDLHDIGKNLVKYMLEGVGFEVIDLGTDVSADKIVSAVKEYKPDFLALSALLTTTMLELGSVIHALEVAGVRDQVKVIVGGAPVSKFFSAEIGADYYFADAALAAKEIKQMVEQDT
jgi:5-methyltetrahydrofolate--homocysteine methyltransferase